jgi:hypothetical protein
VYHRIKFISYDPYIVGGPKESVVDAIHVQPAWKDKRSRDVPGRFDTALINDGTGQATSVTGNTLPYSFHHFPNIIAATGYRIGQIRLVFLLPDKVIAKLLPPHIIPPKYLAYVKWLSSFPRVLDPNHLLYKIKHSMKDGVQSTSIIPVANICWSVHLFPEFGQVAPHDWTSATVLELCGTFFVNSTSDRHTVCMQHFSRILFSIKPVNNVRHVLVPKNLLMTLVSPTP